MQRVKRSKYVQTHLTSNHIATDAMRLKADWIKAIFLVGGFGSSIYLRECLQKQHPDIQIIQPPDA